MGAQMATDPISIRQLKNASDDAQDLERYVNDSIPAMVQTRIGGQKPNYAKLVADFVGSAQSILTETQEHADDALDRMTSFVDRGSWQPLTAYARKDVVTVAGIAYITLFDHTSSSVFADDVAAGLWQVFQGVNRAELSDGAGGGLVGVRQAGDGALLRTVLQKLLDTPGVTDYEQAVWSGKQWLEVPRGVYNLSADTYITGQISTGARYSGAGKLITRESVLSLTKNWLIQAGTDSDNNTIPNFIRRAIEVRRPNASSLTTETSYERTPNSTALGLSVHFMCEFMSFSPTKTEELTPYIIQGADYLCAMQYRDINTARFGGIKGAVNDNNTTCFGTATAARGLLRAFKATGKAKYLNAARNAVAYFKVLANPNPVYQALYGETPIPPVAENAGFQGFCDRIQASDSISITASDWNLVAAVFLKEMYELTGDTSLPPIYNAARDWHVYGVANGYDYFALKNAAPTSKVSVTWPFFSGHTYADGAWHRLGDPVNTATVGTDQIEYGLASLFELNYNPATLQAIYELYCSLQHANKGVTDFGTAFNSRRCWTGYFRINSPVYGGSNGAIIDPATSRFYGDYYDVQGSGALLPFKWYLAPADVALAMELAQIAYLRGALVDENLNTIWSTTPNYEFHTVGIIPRAKAGIAMIEVMEAV